jgi:hypothetical protein
MSTYSLIQALPEAWRSTNGLAIVGSIGIHALVLAVLPFASLEPQDIDLQSSIGVVELTPEEQSRVPQVAADPSVIPPANTTQQASPSSYQGFQSEILPPLPAPPPFLPPPPGTTPMYQMPSDDSLPPPAPIPLPPPPQNPSLLSQNPFGQPPAPQPNSNQNIQMQQISPPANAVPPVPNLPPTRELQPSPPPAQPNSSYSQNRFAANNSINNSINRQVQPSTPRTLPDRTKQELIARRNALAQRLAAANQNRTAAPTQRDTQSDRDRLLAEASQQQVQRAKEREERTSRLAAALQQRQQQSNPNPTNPTSDRTSRLAAVLQQRHQQSSPNPTNPTSDRASRLAALQQRLTRPIGDRPDSKPEAGQSAQTIAQIAALQQQYQKIQQIYPQFTTATPIRKQVSVCNKRINGGEAIISTLIDPTGKIVVGPDAISKDSPRSVQRAAIAYVKRYPFTKSTTPVHQTFRLEFNHNPKLCSKK